MNCFGTYFTHFTYVPQPGVGWGGGVGCNDMRCTCTQIRCYAIALSHMFDARQLHLHTCWMLRSCTCAHVMFDATQLHLRTCWMLRNCTCAHVGCYAIVLAHMFDATQLHLRTCSMLRNCTFGHVRCYAIALAVPSKRSQQKERQRNVCRCPRTSRREGQAMDMACWTLACEPAFVQAAVPQTLSKGVLKKCETN